MSAEQQAQAEDAAVMLAAVEERDRAWEAWLLARDYAHNAMAEYVERWGHTR